MKTSRQNKILEIISSQDIETQHQLMEALREHGVKSTQATVSRDIKELRLIKELSPTGRYRYVAVGRDDMVDYDQRLRKIFRESVTSYAVAQNIIVIKTLPGLANAACSTLDGMNIHDLVGTLAGDDTAFLAMRDNAAAERFCHEIEEML
ncbi:MAG TPA: arginine repressor [Firmicutes bacterium]|nr:arginine repressor [Bacillota bacterium]